MKFTKLNEIQIPTWRWLHLNSTELEVDVKMDHPYEGAIVKSEEPNVSIEKAVNLPRIENIPNDVRRMYEFVLDNKNFGLTISIPKGIKVTEPITINFELNETNPTLIDFVHIKAEEGSCADVIVTYHSTGVGNYFHNGFAYIQADSNSHVRFIKTQMLQVNDIHIDNNAVDVKSSGQGDVILCDLGGGQVVAGCNIVLEEAKSRSNLQSIYIGDKERTLDFNYRMELRGKESDGKILVRGALADQAKKSLKSNIDFIRGATASKGSEEETVLTLSENAVNLSVPLLLCGEDNVEGSHATSSGKPSPAKLFYLMSRGLSEKQAKQLLIKAQFTPILENIPSASLKNTVQERIGEVLA